MQSFEFDLVIVGGGLVGASFANALAECQLRIGIIEQFQPDFAAHPSFDDRTVALSYGSKLHFERLNLWSSLAPLTTSIDTIHISDQGQLGVTKLLAAEEKVPALGYVIANKDLAGVLYDRLAKLDNVTLLCPAKVLNFQISPNSNTDSELNKQVSKDISERDVNEKVVSESENRRVQLEIEYEGATHSVSSRLLVAADGIHSTIRELAGIKAKSHDYGQTAIICNVSTQFDHHGVAYERFTASGPLAFLPFSTDGSTEHANRYSVVWTVATCDADAIAALSEVEFSNRLQSIIGFRQGRLLSVGARSQYPLSLVQADKSISNRLALIGNASHSLHPVAGQGFNLGLRDAAVLAEMLLVAQQKRQDIGSSQILERYQLVRQKDHAKIIQLTDGLVRLFTYQLFVIKHLRGLGLMLTDKLPVLKSMLARQTMGLVNQFRR